MRSFVRETEDDAQAERVWEATRDLARAQLAGRSPIARSSRSTTSPTAARTWPTSVGQIRAPGSWS
jgi:hypothetical protein